MGLPPFQKNKMGPWTVLNHPAPPRKNYPVFLKPTRAPGGGCPKIPPVLMEKKKNVYPGGSKKGLSFSPFFGKFFQNLLGFWGPRQKKGFIWGPKRESPPPHPRNSYMCPPAHFAPQKNFLKTLKWSPKSKFPRKKFPPVISNLWKKVLNNLVNTRGKNLREFLKRNYQIGKAREIIILKIGFSPQNTIFLKRKMGGKFPPPPFFLLLSPVFFEWGGQKQKKKRKKKKI